MSARGLTGPALSPVAWAFAWAMILAACVPRSGPVAQVSARKVGPLMGDFADPFVLRVGDRYYAFATGAHGWNLQLAISTDLATWTPLGDPLPRLPEWAAEKPGLTWAPAVLEREAGYVLYYTTRDRASGFQCISRAFAARPDGPYVDDSAQPLICQADPSAQLCGSIDPSPFVDRDGRPYLLWKSDENSTACRTPPRLWAQQLSDDGRELLGAPISLLAREHAWEGDIVEAPSMVERGGFYYLFYSANWYEGSAYAIGYAICTSPLGGCRKVTVDSPFLKSGGAAAGPGGQELFTASDGTLWMAYHAWTAPHTSYAAGGARSLRLARLQFSSDGAPLAVNLP